MDSEVMKWAIGIFSGIYITAIGWVWRGVLGNSKEIENAKNTANRQKAESDKALSTHMLYAANNYVRHPQLQNMEDRILGAIGELKQDIKNKADK